MTLCIIHETANNGVAVVNPAFRDKRDDEDDAAFLERIKARAVPEGAASAIIDSAALPDRSLRHWWRWQNGMVVVAPEFLDGLKARAIAALDAEFERVTTVSPSVDRARRLKLDEAQEVLARDADRIAIDPAQYPMLMASKVGAEAIEETARRVYAAFKAERAELARREAIRIEAKSRIKVATSPEHIEQVRASVTWGTP